MTPRTAQATDIPAILALWNPAILNTSVTFNSTQKTPQDLAQMLAEKQALGHGFLIAEKAGVLLGFATYGQFRAGIGYAHTMEHTILLAKTARGAKALAVA